MITFCGAYLSQLYMETTDLLMFCGGFAALGGMLPNGLDTKLVVHQNGLISVY